MARKKRDESSGGNWLDTYADMVTLLLTFFVMLFSMSSVEEEKWEMLLQAFTNRSDETDQVVLTPEGEGDDIGRNQAEEIKGDIEGEKIEEKLPKDFDQLYKYLKQFVEQNEMGSTVSVEKGEDSVYIRFSDNVFFDPDKSYLKEGSMDILNFLGDCLKSVESQIMTININGHTAAVPSIEDYHVSDRRLSSERASSVAIFFEEEKEIDPKKIIAIGYGKNFPVDTNDTEEGRKKNRRVDMMIISNESKQSSDDLLLQMLTGTFDADRYPESGKPSNLLLPENAQPNTDEASQDTASVSNPADAQSASSAPPDGQGQDSSASTALDPAAGTGSAVLSAPKDTSSAASDASPDASSAAGSTSTSSAPPPDSGQTSSGAAGASSSAPPQGGQASSAAPPDGSGSQAAAGSSSANLLVPSGAPVPASSTTP